MSETKKATIDNETLLKVLQLLNSQNLELNIKPHYHPGSILGIVIGGIICAVGFGIIYLGVIGNIEWILQAGSLVSRLSNASPGVFVALIGFLIIWRYKPGKYAYEIAISPSKIVIEGVKAEIIGPTIVSRGLPPRQFK